MIDQYYNALNYCSIPPLLHFRFVSFVILLLMNRSHVIQFMSLLVALYIDYYLVLYYFKDQKVQEDY